MISVNGKLMLEPYKGKNKLEAKVSSGFATVKQKDTLIGLVIVADGHVNLGKESILVKKGQIAYIPEEILYTHDWAKKTFHLEGSDKTFIMAESIHVVAIGET